MNQPTLCSVSKPSNQMSCILPVILLSSVAFFASTSIASATQASHTLDSNARVPAATATSLSLQKIEQIALSEVPGGKVVSIERDFELGRSVFEVEVIDKDGWELDLTIDAENGKILRRKRDD